MSALENFEEPEHLAVMHEAEQLVGNPDLDAIEEHHGEMIAVWINFVRQLRELPDSHQMTIDESNRVFGECISKFADHVDKYTAFILEDSESQTDAVATLMGVGAVLDKERVDALNEVSQELGGNKITAYADPDVILRTFHSQLAQVESDEEKQATFTKLITYGLNDDIQAIEALVTRVKASVDADEELSHREMIRFIYDNLQDKLTPSKMDHVRDIAKTALGVTIGIVLARRLR